jgi:hypothetical protein
LARARHRSSRRWPVRARHGAFDVARPPHTPWPGGARVVAQRTTRVRA